VEFPLRLAPVTNTLSANFCLDFCDSNRLIYEELELDVTHTKQTTGPRSNRLFFRFFFRICDFGHSRSDPHLQADGCPFQSHRATGWGIRKIEGRLTSRPIVAMAEHQARGLAPRGNIHASMIDELLMCGAWQHNGDGVDSRRRGSTKLTVKRGAI